VDRERYEDSMKFEAEVRRVAEFVWGLAPGDCQPRHYENHQIIKELDGIARLRDVTHLIMATTSTKLDKAKTDVRKLNAAEGVERDQSPAVSKWLITEKQLDAEHILLAKKSNVRVMTLDQFRRRAFDALAYLGLRESCAFGSARDPHTNTITISPNTYVPLPMDWIKTSEHENHPAARKREVSLEWVAARLSEGFSIVLVAPFGSGKSITTRELFLRLGQMFRDDQNHARAPIALNLRDHWGQPHCDEILERHARTIGYGRREDLTIAYKSGLGTLLLDGFDELASQTVVKISDRNFLRQARREALVGIRGFAQKMPAGAGVFYCGRDNYFDTVEELVHSLGLSGKKYFVIRLQEFGEDAAQEFLRRSGVDIELPDWLPRKPLILSYLIARNLFHEIVNIDASQGFGFAWDSFIARICERESEFERSVMDPATLRSVMERLAFGVRGKPSGTGPISGIDLSEAYVAETGDVAGEGVLTQLQRLPGLTQRDSDPSARTFVDEDFLGALQGSVLARQIVGSSEWMGTVPIHELSDKALSMANYLVRKGAGSIETVVAVAQKLPKAAYGGKQSYQFNADCVALAISMASDEAMAALDFRGLVVRGASFGTMNLEDVTVLGLELRECTIGHLLLGPSAGSGSVKFLGCSFGKISGVASQEGLPSWFSECDVSEYDNVSTNSAVMRSSIDPRVKALLSLLRKLYKQAGAGRKIGALTRGVTDQAAGKHIASVINLLQSHGLVAIYDKVVHPVRRQASRVEAILAAPGLSQDPVVLDCLAI
jgi:hypothetical protein